jgi:hypothetical protein
MKTLLALVVVFLLAVCFISRPAGAVPGSSTLVFNQTSTALTAAPNVAVCVMTSGMVRDLAVSGVPQQTIVCDSITGYFLGKTLTVNITGANRFAAFNRGAAAINFNHTGFPSNNALTIPAGLSWSEGVR